MKLTALIASLLLLAACNKPASSGPAPSSSSAAPATAPAAYSPRIGIAVSTGSRTCVAIKNANLTSSSTLTLVSPLSPQKFAQAQVATPATTPCPITQNIDPSVSNYNLTLAPDSGLPKMTPFLAVVAPSGAFSTSANGNVSANLDADNKTESFRACTASDGIHLTVWSGNPLDGPLLWHGYYYEPGNTGVAPACTPKETVNP